MTSEKLLFPLVRRLPVPRPRNDRGDRLDRDVAWLRLVANARAADRDVRGRTPAEARAELMTSIRLVQGPARAVRRVDDDEIAGRPVRIYDPGGALGTLVYFHGGGWVVGDLDTHDHLCRRLAAEGEQRVIAVHYRRAPEHPFPAPIEDAVAVYGALASSEAPGAVAVGGDSAGGNVAAVLCQVVRDRGELPRPAFQLLVYPATDFRRVTASHRALAHGYLLDKEHLDWYQAAYAPDVLHRLASPLLHPDLGDLPPAIVVSAGFDPLRDDGELYAEGLAKAGVEVDDLRFPGQLHGFVNMDGALPSADRALRRIIEACRGRWSSSPPSQGGRA